VQKGLVLGAKGLISWLKTGSFRKHIGMNDFTCLKYPSQSEGLIFFQASLTST